MQTNLKAIFWEEEKITDILDAIASELSEDGHELVELDLWYATVTFTIAWKASEFVNAWATVPVSLVDML